MCETKQNEGFVVNIRPTAIEKADSLLSASPPCQRCAQDVLAVSVHDVGVVAFQEASCAASDDCAVVAVWDVLSHPV